MNFSSIPWDFILILAGLGVIVPWRGAVRIKTLLARPGLTTADRLSLYGSTIAFQWIIVALVAWRAYARNMSVQEIGLFVADPWRAITIAVFVTTFLCVIQFASLKRIVRMPAAERGPVFEITEKIMPKSSTEILVFTALAATAGLSEEFLYRGFTFAVFLRIFAHSGFPVTIALVTSSIWFGIGHLYQGTRGVLTTFVVGFIFCVARILSGNIFPPIVAHIAVDLIVGLYIATRDHKLRGSSC